MKIGESVDVVQGIYFELTEPVSVSGIKKNSNQIELVFDEPNLLKGFRIKVHNPDKNKIREAYQKAFRLTNLISLKTGMHVFHKRPSNTINGQIETVDNIFTMDAVITKLKNLDMMDTSLSTLLDNDSEVNQQLTHFSNGLKAFRDSNFGESIREFYLVIEKEQLPHLSNFRYLRNGVSHSELYEDTVEKLESIFGIICIERSNSELNPNGKYVNMTDPVIQDILEDKSKMFLVEVLKFLDNKINIKTN
jgi:hypothetical protein